VQRSNRPQATPAKTQGTGNGAAAAAPSPTPPGARP